MPPPGARLRVECRSSRLTKHLHAVPVDGPRQPAFRLHGCLRQAGRGQPLGSRDRLLPQFRVAAPDALPGPPARRTADHAALALADQPRTGRLLCPVCLLLGDHPATAGHRGDTQPHLGDLSTALQFVLHPQLRFYFLLPAGQQNTVFPIDQTSIENPQRLFDP